MRSVVASGQNKATTENVFRAPHKDFLVMIDVISIRVISVNF